MSFVSAAINFLLIVVVFFGLLPMVRREADEMQRISLETRDAMEKMRDTLNAVAQKNLGGYLEAHRKTQEVLESAHRKTQQMLEVVLTKLREKE